MCGIFALLNNNIPINIVKTEFEKGKHRGPESSVLTTNFMKMVLGFHRLAINGLNEQSNQPLIIQDIVLICNGEIYNYQYLYKQMNIEPVTGSDCEVIIHLYLKYGIEQTLQMLDCVYAFVLYDNRITPDLNNRLYVARDPFGIRPLYYLKSNDMRPFKEPLYGFASELKCLEKIYNNNSYLDNSNSINQFKPGTYSTFNLSSQACSSWQLLQENKPYFIPSFSYTWFINDSISPEFISNLYLKLATHLNTAVEKRCLTTERPIACLLSGGLDSSLITALVNNYYKTRNITTQLETYSIGLAGSEDLKFAKIVADYLGTNHTEIIVSEKEMFDAIPEVIFNIESYDTTTVRASIGNYLLGKYIATHSDAKVIFNGDGADELFGGYLYMNKCPDDIEFDKETRRLLEDIHLFDVLRSDKSISSHGLEPRTPFLDRSFVNFVLSIPPYFRNHSNGKHCEKYFLRSAFSQLNFLNYEGKSLLPPEILLRKKEAFSDGVSGQKRSLYIILQEQIAFYLNLEENTNKFTPSIETEKYYYNKIFNSFYQNCAHILPYFWMPKYTDAVDPSARTLDLYNEHKSSS
jgi:asparagine synthase (glutamine-hydrolysing)